jgi:nitronate monooxygenase
VDFEENRRLLYDEALKLGDEGWGKEHGRITTYAGTGVGLVKSIVPAGQGFGPLEKWGLRSSNV